MKLLIVTQVIDTEHPVLGFFHRWVEEFAKHCEHVHVICLQAGRYNLPANVTVHSLGKELGNSRVTFVSRFFKLIWQLRHEYDSVFVHMNQEYILLGGLFWKLFQKRVSMWRNHYSGTILTNVAAKFCNVIFYTSSASYTKRFKHAKAMPIGIDSTLFYPKSDVERKKDSLLYVGRLSFSKRIMMILEALAVALSERPTLSLTIVGGTTSSEDEEYEFQLKQFVVENKLPVSFLGPVSWSELPEYYSAHELCINMSPPGMFDKVIGESLLCECDILTTNQDLIDMLGEMRSMKHLGVPELSEQLVSFIYKPAQVQELKEYVVKSQSLSSLVKIVHQELK